MRTVTELKQEDWISPQRHYFRHVLANPIQHPRIMRCIQRNFHQVWNQYDHPLL